MFLRLCFSSLLSGWKQDYARSSSLLIAPKDARPPARVKARHVQVCGRFVLLTSVGCAHVAGGLAGVQVQHNSSRNAERPLPWSGLSARNDGLSPALIRLGSLEVCALLCGFLARLARLARQVPRVRNAVAK